MHKMKMFGSRRHLVARTLVTTALLGSTFLVGLATNASAAPPYHLFIATQPSATDASGAALSTQPVIDIEDSTNAIANLTGPVTATITSGGVSVSGGSVVATAGVATFTALALNAHAGSYTLTFADATDAATTVVSATITVTVGSAKALVLTNKTSISGAINAIALTPQPIVDVVDSGGNIVTTDTSTVTAAFTSTGTTLVNATKSAVAGVATFAGLAITAPIDTTIGGLTFTDGALTSDATGTLAVTGPATKLVISTPPSVTAVNGVALAIQPVVTVEDAGNFPVKGDASTVTAAFVAGSVGSTITNNTKTVVAGAATFVGMALNAAPGNYNIIFTDGTLTSATTTAQTAVSIGAAAKLVIVTAPSATVAAGAALAVQPVVDIDDSGGNVITSNTSVVTAALTTGTGTIVHGTATAVAGVATFVGLALNAVVGPYTLTFTDATLTPAISTTVTVSAGAASQLIIVTQPSTTVASGVALAIQPVVKVADPGGNVIIGNNSIVTATVTSAAGTITNNQVTVSATTGLATFAGLTLKELVGPYTLTFNDGGLTAAVSTPITVSAGVAAQLVVTTATPTSVPSGAAFAVAPVVKVEDSAGNVVTTDTSTVSVKIATGGVSVTPSTKAAIAGVATFSGLAINALLGLYTLDFSDGTLTPTTMGPIDVTVGAATHLAIFAEPSTSTASGVVLTHQPTVAVEDSGGNIVNTVSTGAVSATVASGAGGSLSAGSTATIVAGVAIFSGLTLTGVPGTSYTLNFAGDSFNVTDTTKILIGLPQAALVLASVHATYGRAFTLKTTGGTGTGGLSYTVVNGSAKGCVLAGATLKSSTAGTCIVTATKANDSTYASIESPATTVTFAKLPIPRALRLTFATNSSALSGATRNAIVALVRKLTVHSVVSITGYAKGNAALAHRRAAAAGTFLRQRLHVRVQLRWSTASSPSSVVIATKSQ
jgi:hypothetical protein